jgi:hypothetical protein
VELGTWVCRSSLERSIIRKRRNMIGNKQKFENSSAETSSPFSLTRIIELLIALSSMLLTARTKLHTQRVVIPSIDGILTWIVIDSSQVTSVGLLAATLPRHAHHPGLSHLISSRIKISYVELLPTNVEQYFAACVTCRLPIKQWRPVYRLFNLFPCSVLLSSVWHESGSDR